MTRKPAAFATYPGLEGRDERRDPQLSHSVPLCRGQAVEVALDIENRIDPAHCLNRERRLGNIGEHEQLAPPVRPTGSLKDRSGLARGMVEVIEPSICIGLQDAGVAREMSARVLAATVARVEKDRRRRCRTAERPVVAHIGP
jgi:hypothetical protein